VFNDVTTQALWDTAGANVGCEFGDYDGDGDLDLFVADNRDGDKLFRNELANGNHWLEIDLVGTLSNRSAIGARVTVLTLGLKQIREVSGGGGYNSQPTMRLHYGLGSAVTVDRVHVRWPSGMIEETTMVVSNQRITLVEGTLPLAVGDDRPRRTLDLTASPNPAFGITRIEYELPRASRVTIHILDVTGRVVRVLERSTAREASRHRATWDGTDVHGRRVSPGVYLAQLTTEDRSSRVRLVRY
jgi:hypothetical protein